MDFNNKTKKNEEDKEIKKKSYFKKLKYLKENINQLLKVKKLIKNSLIFIKDLTQAS